MKVTLYKDGQRLDIPAIDSPGWILHGWSTEPPAPQAVPEPPTPNVASEAWDAKPVDDEPTTAPVPPALTLINTAVMAGELEALPSIGPRLAQKIFDARPANGYPSLDAVAEVAASSRVSVDDLAGWVQG